MLLSLGPRHDTFAPLTPSPVRVLLPGVLPIAGPFGTFCKCLLFLGMVGRFRDQPKNDIFALLTSSTFRTHCWACCLLPDGELKIAFGNFKLGEFDFSLQWAKSTLMGITYQFQT